MYCFLQNRTGGMKLYRIGKEYKIETKKGIFYTAKVLEEDTFSIGVLTVRGEELVLNKEDISRAKILNSTGVEGNERLWGFD